MAEYEVTCVDKPKPDSLHEHITHIGNIRDGWRLTKLSAIAHIDSKVDAFYTVDKATGKRTYLGVVREQGKAAYLRTYADGQWTDNLLALGECMPGCRTA
jgi:hypothetical protein